MDLKSVSGTMLIVKDVTQSKAFYEALGFVFKGEIENGSTKAYLNWYWIELLQADSIYGDRFKADAAAPLKGAGISIQVNVEQIDAYYQAVIDNGVKPANSVESFPWGKREFIVRDPDGYVLVFFEKK